MTTTRSLSRFSWLLRCRDCGNQVRLVMPEQFDVHRWQRYIDEWDSVHASNVGQLDLVPAGDTPGLPPAVTPYGLEVRPCR